MTRRLFAASLAAAAPALLGACASSAPRPASDVADLAALAALDVPAAAAPSAADADAARTLGASPALLAAVTAARAAPFEPFQDDGGAAPEVVSRAPRVNSERDPVGAYGQPEWTTHRRFARTRLYVLPEGTMAAEQWWRGTWDDGEAPGHLFQTEFEIGLPHRFQFDLYGNYTHEDGVTKWTTVQPELRWALADWGVLPLNPTLYLEYKWEHGSEDVAEAKLLLGDELGPGVNWGMNLSCEQELGGARSTELAVTQAVSWTLADRQFSWGIEFEYDRVTEVGSRGNPSHEFYAGPSFQWRPTETTHLDVVPLKGWHDAHDWRVFVIFGIDFGGRTEKAPMAPVSSKSR